MLGADCGQTPPRFTLHTSERASCLRFSFVPPCKNAALDVPRHRFANETMSVTGSDLAIAFNACTCCHDGSMVCPFFVTLFKTAVFVSVSYIENMSQLEVVEATQRLAIPHFLRSPTPKLLGLCTLFWRSALIAPSLNKPQQLLPPAHSTSPPSDLAWAGPRCPQEGAQRVRAFLGRGSWGILVQSVSSKKPPLSKGRRHSATGTCGCSLRAAWMILFATGMRCFHPKSVLTQAAACIYATCSSEKFQVKPKSPNTC